MQMIKNTGDVEDSAAVENASWGSKDEVSDFGTGGAEATSGCTSIVSSAGITGSPTRAGAGATAAFEPGITTGAGAVICAAVPQLVQKRDPSPSALPQLVQKAITVPR